jgi:hypothetical protein
MRAFAIHKQRMTQLRIFKRRKKNDPAIYWQTNVTGDKFFDSYKSAHAATHR